MRKSVDNVNQLDLADEVFEAIHEVMHLYRSHLGRAGDGDEAGPRARMEMRALAFFVRHPGLTLSDLASFTGRDKSQLARLVAALREQGLLDAHPDEEDRRIVRLQPTDEGLQLHRSMQVRQRKRAREAIAGLDEAQCRQLMELLGRIRENLGGEGLDRGRGGR